MPRSLTYLDWSHIVHLTDARRDNRSVYDAALAAWRRSDASLALSRVHLVEGRRHDDAETRAERVRTIQDLIPVRTDIIVRQQVRIRPLAMKEREILAALLSTNALSLQLSELSSFAARLPIGAMDAFPSRWEEASAVNAIRSYDDQEFRAFVDLVHKGVEEATATLIRPAGAGYTAVRLTDLSDKPLSAAELAATESAFAKALEQLETLPDIVRNLPAGVQNEMLREEVESLRALYRRAAAVGLRQAWGEAHNVDVSRERRTLEEIARDRAFRRTAEGVFREVLQIDGVRAAELASDLPIEACPGTWLSQAVDQEIRKGEAATAPSSPYDLDHLVHLPYVDEFFADKRIGHHVASALRRGDCPAVLKARRSIRVVPRSVQALALEFATL